MTTTNTKKTKKTAPKPEHVPAAAMPYLTNSEPYDITKQSVLGTDNHEAHLASADIEPELVPGYRVNDDDARLSDRERENNRRNEFLYPVGTRVFLKLAAMPVPVAEGPSIYDPTVTVGAHTDFLMVDPDGREVTVSVYEAQEPSFKKGINRRTNGDLCMKFRKIAIDGKGHQTPTEISLLGRKFNPSDPDTLGGVAAYLKTYPVEFLYDYKKRPDGTITERPGWNWWFPEDYTQQAQPRNWIRF